MTVLRLLTSLLIALLLAVPLSAAPIDHPSCSPAPENEGLVYESQSIAWLDCNPWDSCWEQNFRRVQERVENSWDPYIHTLYLSMVTQMNPKWSYATREHYLALAAERESAWAHYLASRAAIPADEKVKHMARALELDAEFAPAWLTAATAVANPRPLQDKAALTELLGTPEENLRVYQRLCPTRVYELLVVAAYMAPYPEAATYTSAEIRSIEGKRSQTRAILSTGLSWILHAALDRKWIPPEEDLEWLASLGSNPDGWPLAALDHMADGYEWAENIEKAEFLRTQIDRQYPCTDGGGLTNAPTSRHRSEWELAHGGDPGLIQRDPQAAQSFFNTIWGHARECSDWNRYDSALLEASRLGIENLSNEEFLAVADRWEALWPSVEPFYKGDPSPDGVLTDEYLRRGIRTERLLALAVRELDRVERIQQDPQDFVSQLDFTEERRRGRAAYKAAQKAIALARLAHAHLVTSRNYERVESLLQTATTHLATVPEDQQSASFVTDAQERVAKVTQTLQQERLARVTRHVEKSSTEPSNKPDESVEIAVDRTERPWTALHVPLPPFSLEDRSGNQWTSKDLSGKTCLVVFWASWCGPCRSEHEFLQEVFQRFNARDDILVLSWNVEESAPFEREKYLNAHPNLTFPILLADDYYREVIRSTQGLESALPQSWIVKDGLIVGFKTGFDGRDPVRWVNNTISIVERVARGESISH